MHLYPMKMKPCFKDYLWGADTLYRVFGKDSGFDVTAESWELSAHSGGSSVIDSGVLSGTEFKKYISEHPEAAGNAAVGDFPVLIKFLDVSSMLSVQVHPSDETALEGEQGKAEVWYIVDAKPGAYIYYGLNRKVERSEFEEMLKNGTVTECLRRVEVEPGQVWFITPGIVHSAGDGVLVAEVQQSSNTTFRVYDFDRVDANGNKRELHIKRACDVMNFDPVKSEDMRINSSVYAKGYVYENLFECGYFKLDRINLKGGMLLNTDKTSFNSLLCIKGEGNILFDGISYEFKAGDCYFIPAGMGKYEIHGKAELLLTRL